MVTPFLAVLVAFYIVPLGYAGYLSLFTSKLIGGTAFGWFANYSQAFHDRNFWVGVEHVGLFIVIGIPLSLTLATAFALALDSGRARGARFVRLGMFIPYAIPVVVAALMWGYLYGHSFGLITQIASKLGFAAPNLLSPGSILGSLINITLWEFVGYNVIVLYSALRAVPPELLEAAAVDGASQWRIAWSIKLPIIRPAIFLLVIFGLIGAFQLFNEPNLLSTLAPGSIGSNYTPNLYAYNVAFQNQNVNYAAALSFLLGFITILVSYVVQLIIRWRTRGS